MRLFRVAKPAGPAWNVAKTAVQVVIVWAFALVLLPAVVITIEDAVGIPRWSWRGRYWIGAVLLAFGSATGLSSAWFMAVRGGGTPVPFDAARELVLVGCYRIVRNPMAVSAIIQLVGITVILGSAGTLLLAVAGGVVWDRFIRPAEERDLAVRFGPSYERYRSAVRCWIPRWPPYSAG